MPKQRIQNLINMLEEKKNENGNLLVACNVTGIGYLAEEEILRKDHVIICERKEGKILKIGD